MEFYLQTLKGNVFWPVIPYLTVLSMSGGGRIDICKYAKIQYIFTCNKLLLGSSNMCALTNPKTTMKGFHCAQN